MSPQAAFYVNGVQKYSANIGDSLVLDIPGYQQIWLTQYQNGVLQYDGPEGVPTAPLTLTDPPDLGTFQGTAFEVINGQKGNQITSWTFQINPAGTSGASAGTTSSPATPSGSTCSTGVCTASPPPPVSSPPPPSSVPNNNGTTTTVPSGGSGGGLNPFGGLPGEGPPVATTQTGGPGQGTSGAPPSGTTATQFSFSEFVKNPIFWLLLVVLGLVYFMSEG